ncbi:acetyltransferase [Flavobacterium tegetincola]|uniref:acetyltransferase n=1 Tax=Flavobacterium tegetincola TaxID=150172 RepID=UPI0004259708|nr:acetyltransferase [Flavobacterium tegetincola]
MKIIIYGVGKFAEAMHFEFTNETQFSVCGFCIESKYIVEREINNLPVIDFEMIESCYPPEEYQLFIALGLNKERQRIFDLAKGKGYKMVSHISQKAITYKDLTYGENTFVSAGSQIGPFVSIGDNSFLIGTAMGHHVTISAHCMLSNCTFGGNVHIGDFSFIGMNAAIQQNVKIGKNNIIGMGCNIEKDTEDNQIYHAGKATVLRNITTDQFEKKYLK